MNTTTRPRTLTGAYHRNCGCPRCYEGNAAWQRERRHGLKDGTWQPLVDAEPARRHIEYLHEHGLSYATIARRAGISNAGLSRIRRSISTRPRHERMYADNLKAILAVKLDDSTADLPGGAYTSSCGTVRRLHALRAIGWPADMIAAKAGLARRTLTRAGNATSFEAETHRRIRDVYDLLHDQDPLLAGADPSIVKRNQTIARRNGWPTPTGWIDIDRDEEPLPRRRWTIRYATPSAGERTQAVIEQTAELAALGETRERIAQRIGISWNSITVAHSRAGTRLPDIRQAA
jgi:AraC-like DNA-binding protein